MAVPVHSEMLELMENVHDNPKKQLKLVFERPKLSNDLQVIGQNLCKISK